jgi:hypothetical protein
MPDDDRRDMYETAGSGAEEWGEPTRPENGRRRRLESIISVRFPPDEIDRVRTAAREQDITVSAYIRAAALRQCEDARPGRILFLCGNDTARVATDFSLTFVQPTTSSIETGSGVGMTMAGSR